MANTGMRRHLTIPEAALLCFAACAGAASLSCTEGGASPTDSGTDGGPPGDTNPQLRPDADSGSPGEGNGQPLPSSDVTVLVPMSQDGRFTLASMMLGVDGRLRDNDVRLELPGNASAIAIRSDGREALVMYGRAASAERGGVAIDLAPDGSQATIGTGFSVTTQHGVTDVLFTGIDEAVASMRGPEDDHLLTLRKQNGTWTVGLASPTPPWPQRIYDIQEPGRLLFLSSGAISGQSEALPMARGADDRWQVDGQGVLFGGDYLVGFAMSRDGSRAYAVTEGAATDDPANPSGQILSIGKVGAKDWQALLPLATRNHNAHLAMSREGRVMVAVDAVMEMDPTGTIPIAKASALDTFSVAADGTVTAHQGPRTEFPETVVEGLAFGPNETLLAAQVAGEEYYLRSFRRASPSSGEWREISSVRLENALSSTRGIVVGPAIE